MELRRRQSRHCGSPHGSQPGTVHHCVGNAGLNIVHDLKSRSLGKLKLLRIPREALDPLDPAGLAVWHIGGHGVKEHVAPGMDPDLGRHLILFAPVVHQYLLNDGQRLVQIRPGFDTFVFRQPQDLMSQIQDLLQILAMPMSASRASPGPLTTQPIKKLTGDNILDQFMDEIYKL